MQYKKALLFFSTAYLLPVLLFLPAKIRFLTVDVIVSSR